VKSEKVAKVTSNHCSHHE